MGWMPPGDAFYLVALQRYRERHDASTAELLDKNSIEWYLKMQHFAGVAEW